MFNSVDIFKLDTYRQGFTPSRFLSLYLLASSSLISCYAFGYADFYEILSVSSIIILSLLNYTKRDYLSLAVSVVFLAVSIFDHSLIRCVSLVAIVFSCSGFVGLGSSLILCALMVSLGTLLRTQLVQYILSPWSLLISALLCSLLISKVSELARRRVFNILMCTYACILICWSFVRFDFGFCQMKDDRPGYGIGKTLSLILGKQLANDAELYFANETPTVVTNKGCVYLDHDSKTIYEKRTFEQRAPWSSNELIAIEPLKVALCHDGALISNIGSELNLDKVNSLWGEYQGGTYHSLGGVDGRLVVGDSDIVGDMLAPYQVNFIRSLAGHDVRYRRWLVFLAILMMVSVLPGARKYTLATTMVAIIIFPFVFPSSYQRGGVRYEGKKIIYPHTELGYGVIRSLQKQGKCCLFTDKDADILVISEGRSSIREEESKIILEPNARVLVGSEMFEAGLAPFGIQNNVQDARQIKKNGKIVALGRLQENGITIFATGSPGRVLLDE